MKDKPIIGITMGDPAGIGPEIAAKVFMRDEIYLVCSPFIIGDLPVMENAVRSFAPGFEICSIAKAEEVICKPGKIEILDLKNVDISVLKSGMPSRMCGIAMMEYISFAAKLALEGRIDAMTTAPINKEAIALAGLKFPGHTEFLADISGAKCFGMMMVGGNLKIMLVTIHEALKDVPSLINRERVLSAIRLSHRAAVDYFGITRPRIGIAGLNPHAGEGGLFGHEEKEEILPAVIQAREEGIDSSDPVPPDTIFHRAYSGDYDIIVAMYHDQGLIPLKMLAFGRAVNVTIGLPFIRTSVDHGTAYDIVGKGLASPESLMEAIKLAAEMAKKRSAIRPDRFKQTS
ncbi:MAG: 4-hydroxythreonine-4-phosphate dehydrogenase PdxA [Nitrospirae bacterium]|nr:4-hydroxythreonine-4-phosphate dehydrogenase PdxA [Nitrospirota bacterium]